jgi:3-hydroxyacyl-CoA dehydrogenase
MLDMAGIDVGAKTVIEYGKAGGLPPDPSYRAMARKLYELGRHGQKTGLGYYRYESRTPVAAGETIETAAALAEQHGIARRAAIGADEIVERLLYPMVNEAAKILEEGIAYRPGDIDTIWVAGYGFPDHRGGPVWMADEIGLAKIVTTLDRFAAARADRFGYWTVAPMLRRLAASGERLSEWRRAG